MYFFRGLFFGNLDGINLIADLLAQMITPKIMDGLDKGLDILDSVYEV